MCYLAEGKCCALSNSTGQSDNSVYLPMCKINVSKYSRESGSPCHLLCTQLAGAVTANA
jgi:hypothetical protein